MWTHSDAIQQTLLILAAANDEALRAGHSHVDVDHLLLSLLVVDGDAAATLMRAGVRLDAAREALADQDRDDLRPLGLDDSLTDQRWVSPVPARYAAQMLPPTDATRAITKEYRRWRETDLRLLERLIVDPQSQGSRLLRRLGIEDPGTLEAVPASGRQRSGSGSGTRAAAVRVEVSVPVLADTIWATVADSIRRPEWDEDAGAVRIIDDRTFTVTPRLVVELAGEGKAGRLANTVATYRVIDQTPGSFVDWEISYPRRDDQEPYLERETIAVTPTDSGARITLTASNSRSRGHLLRRLMDWRARDELRVRAQALAQVS